MNTTTKYFAFVLVALATVFGATATVCAPNVAVHAQDSYGNDLAGVTVTPEWKLFGGWNDFYPVDDVTGVDGEATECSWIAVKGTSLQVNAAEIDGYTCTRGEDTRITAVKGQNTLVTVCTQNVPEVPEFGSILAVGTLGLLGAAFVFSKRT